MIRKSILTALLATSLVVPGVLLSAAPATAATSHVAAASVDAPESPTILKTGGNTLLVMWSSVADAERYTVTIAGASIQRSKTTDSTSASFSDLPLNHRYRASVVALDSSGQQSAAAVTNSVELGDAPSGEVAPTPSAKPTSSSPSTTQNPSPSTSAPEPSASATQTPTQAPSTSTPTPSQSTASAQPQPSAEPSPPASGKQSLVSQVKPTQWGLGTLVALVTFGALMLGRAVRRRRA